MSQASPRAPRGSRAFTIATIGGVLIQARWSAAFAFVLLLWFLANLYLPTVLPKEAPLTLWSLAFISTLFLYASTIAHELGHCLVARARSVPVQAITVSMFGGNAEIPQEDQGPTDEALISIAGPLVSAVAAAVALTARLLIPNLSPPLTLFLEALFLLNAWLAAYNLLPVPPLDGGRALRGLLWRIQGDFLRATNIAVIIGRALAALIATGSVGLFVLSFDPATSPLPPWLASDSRLLSFVGLFLAWFLNNGARTVQRNAFMQQRLAGLTVAKLMSANPPKVQPWVSLAEIASDHLSGRRDRAVAVVRNDDVLVGLVAFSDVAKVPPKERPARTAGEVMTAAADLVTVSPDESVETAIRHMAQLHLNQLPVISEGRLIGMIDRASILELAEPDSPRRGR